MTWFRWTTLSAPQFTLLLMPERHCVGYPSTPRIRFCRQCPDIICRILQYYKGALCQYMCKKHFRCLACRSHIWYYSGIKIPLKIICGTVQWLLYVIQKLNVPLLTWDADPAEPSLLIPYCFWQFTTAQEKGYKFGLSSYLHKMEMG